MNDPKVPHNVLVAPLPCSTMLLDGGAPVGDIGVEGLESVALAANVGGVVAAAVAAPVVVVVDGDNAPDGLLFCDP